MLAHVTAARDMRGDEDALVVPEATIGFPLELALVDVQGHPPQPSRRERRDQRFFVDDFTARDVDQDRAGLHGRKGLATDQLGRLRCPLTTDHHGVTLLEKSTEPLGALQAAESGWQDATGGEPAPRADHPHAGTGAQLSHLPADATGAHDADRLSLEQQGAIGAVVEAMPLLIVSGMVEPSGE